MVNDLAGNQNKRIIFHQKVC